MPLPPSQLPTPPDGDEAGDGDPDECPCPGLSRSVPLPPSQLPTPPDEDAASVAALPNTGTGDDGGARADTILGVIALAAVLLAAGAAAMRLPAARRDDGIADG